MQGDVQRGRGRLHLPMRAVLPIANVDSAIDGLATWNRRHRYLLEICGTALGTCPILPMVRLVPEREVWHYYTCALATEYGLSLLQQPREIRHLELWSLCGEEESCDELVV
jgi:hypothetical protein